MKRIKVKINKGNTIELPSDFTGQMQLEEGDEIMLGYEPERLAEKCFFVEEDNESKLNEEFYCIPMRLFQSVGLKEDDLQLILGTKEITVTSTGNVLTAIPAEVIAAMIDEQVDLTAIADRIVERINDHVLEAEEE